MRNEKLIPFKIIENVVAGESEVVDVVLWHYRGDIKHKGSITSIFKTGWKRNGYGHYKSNALGRK